VKNRQQTLSILQEGKPYASENYMWEEAEESLYSAMWKIRRNNDMEWNDLWAADELGKYLVMESGEMYDASKEKSKERKWQWPEGKQRKLWRKPADYIMSCKSSSVMEGIGISVSDQRLLLLRALGREYLGEHGLEEDTNTAMARRHESISWAANVYLVVHLWLCSTSSMSLY